MKLTGILSVALVFCFCAPNLFADIYSWTDENGVRHFSNVTPPQEDEQTGDTKGNKLAATPITDLSSEMNKNPQAAKKVEEIQGSKFDATPSAAIPPLEAEQFGYNQGKIRFTKTTQKNGETIKEEKWIDDFDDWEPDEEEELALLIFAIGFGAVDAVEQYLSEGGDANRDINGAATILHVAVGSGHKEIVELLLRKGADINAKTADGHTALDIAKESGHEEIIALLRKSGASD